MVHAAPLPARHLYTYRWHGHTVLEFRGEIDLAAYELILPGLDAATSGRRPAVVLDLTPVTFFDCSGVRLLCRAHRRVTARGGRLTLVCPHRSVLRILELLRLTDTFRPVPDFGAVRERGLVLTSPPRPRLPWRSRRT